LPVFFFFFQPREPLFVECKMKRTGESSRSRKVMMFMCCICCGLPSGHLIIN